MTRTAGSALATDRVPQSALVGAAGPPAEVEAASIGVRGIGDRVAEPARPPRGRLPRCRGRPADRRSASWNERSRPGQPCGPRRAAYGATRMRWSRTMSRQALAVVGDRQANRCSPDPRRGAIACGLCTETDAEPRLPAAPASARAALLPRPAPSAASTGSDSRTGSGPAESSTPEDGAYHHTSRLASALLESLVW